MRALQAIREKLNISIEEFSKKSGVTRLALQKIESGALLGLPYKKTVDKIVDTYKQYGVDIDDEDFLSEVEDTNFDLEDRKKYYKPVQVKKSAKGQKNKKSFIYRGEKYASVNELAKKFDVNVSTASKWLSESRVNTRLETRIKDKIYDKNELESLAKELGLSLAGVKARLMNGLSLSDENVSRGQEASTYNFRGEDLTIEEISERTGMNTITLYKRLDYGIPLDPLDEPIGKNLGRPAVTYLYEGEEYTLKELSEKFDLPLGVLRGRITQGTDLKKPYTPRTRNVSKAKRAVATYLYEGEEYTLKELSEKFDLPLGVLRGRIAQGVSLTKPYVPRKNKN